MMNLSGLPGAPLASALAAIAVAVPLWGARVTETQLRAAFGTGELLESCKRQSMRLVNAMLPRDYVDALRAGGAVVSTTPCISLLTLARGRALAELQVGAAHRRPAHDRYLRLHRADSGDRGRGGREDVGHVRLTC